jgi:hypothetical protein
MAVAAERSICVAKMPCARFAALFSFRSMKHTFRFITFSSVHEFLAIVYQNHSNYDTFDKEFTRSGEHFQKTYRKL